MKHQSQRIGSVEWYTPPVIFETLGLSFDLDPCHPHDKVLPWIPAKSRYTVLDDGLKQPWFGRVWCNPPYGNQTGVWLRRLADHGDGVALVMARTDTQWFQDAARSAHMLLFLTGRVHFLASTDLKPRGRGGCGSVLMAWGAECADALASVPSSLGFAVHSIYRRRHVG